MAPPASPTGASPTWAGPTWADFAGTWHIVRVIRDRCPPREGHLEGVARFVPDDAGYLYEEEGRLRLPGMAPMATLRRYLWRPTGDGVNVLYDDGRPFHAFALGPRAEAEHACAPDTYAVGYDFRAWPEWRAVWRVKGPKKDYSMDTVYRRDR